MKNIKVYFLAVVVFFAGNICVIAEKIDIKTLKNQTFIAADSSLPFEITVWGNYKLEGERYEKIRSL